MSLLINILVLTAMVYLIGRKQPDQPIFFAGALLKILAGIILGLIYFEYYEGGDTIRYWQAAQNLSGMSYSDWQSNMSKSEIGHFPNMPRAILFSKILSGFIMVTKGNYWIVSSYFSIISFLAYWYFYRQIRTTLPNLKWPVIIGFLLLPSTLFWSTGIMKGALTNPALVFLAAFTLKLFFRKKVHLIELLPISLSLVLLFFIKYYLLIIILPVIVYVLFDRWAFKVGLHKGISGALYAIIITGTLAIAPAINPNLKIAKLPEIIYRNQQTFGTDKTIPTVIEPTWSSLISNIPNAAFIGLFGPTIFDNGKVFGLIPRIENLFILLATGFSIFLLFRQRLFTPDILVIGTSLYILTLAIALPLAAPNYGALVRYTAPFTPFLVSLVLILPTWWMQKKLNR